MAFQVLLTLSVRFFIFDFVLFKDLRNYLKTKGYIYRKLLSCPFCQGFWSGLGVFLATHFITYNIKFILLMLSFGFVTAYLSMITTAIFYPLIDKYEKSFDTL